MTAIRRPAPQQGIFDVPYWQYAAVGELRLQRCTECGHHRYPPAPVCPECLALGHTWEPLSGAASLLAWTVFHRQYFPEIPVPYVVVAVRTLEGPILLGNLAGASAADLRHGMRMRASFEDVTSAEGTWRICQWTPDDTPSRTKEQA